MSEWIGGVHIRSRWARLIRGLVRAVSEGKTGDAALLAAAEHGGMGGMLEFSDRTKIGQMKRMLAHPNVQEAIRGVYELADFGIDEAVALHVKHMRGGVGPDGVAVAPNYAALKDYLKATTPAEPSRLHVLTARVPAVREVRPDGSPPPMSARAIGEVKGDDAR